MARTMRWVLFLLGTALVVAIVARQLGKQGRSAPVPSAPSWGRDGMIDEEGDESFPASDAPSHWAGGTD
jgi:hypothetical protein